MRAIVPNEATAVTRKDSERVEQALAVVSGRSVQNALTGIADKLTDALAAERPAAWPFWKTEPCPPWCDSRHTDGDFYDDRSHWYQLPGTIELSLHDPWYAPGSPAAENVTGRDIPAARGPQTIEVGATQHYREGVPTVLLVVPRFDQDGRADGEMTVRLTVGEAAALRDRFIAVLNALGGPAEAR